MRLSSARELKEKIRSIPRPVIETRTFSVGRAYAGARLTNPVEFPVMAVGVAPRQGYKRDFAVAVRVFPGQEREVAKRLRALQRFEDEVDVAYGVRYSPRALTLSAGVSCGHPEITAGTLGGFVQDNAHYYILSNSHVLANSGLAQAGDPILRPGPADIRTQGGFHVVGHLSDWVPLTPRGSVDAALARFSGDVGWFYPGWYDGIGQMDANVVEDRFEVRNVVKRGRTTGVTTGIVTAFELDDVVINYGTSRSPHRVTFDNQIEIVGAPDPRRPFSQGGDSGSFILESQALRPYALLYGGGPDAAGVDRTLGHFMPEVLSSLNVWPVSG